MNLPRSKIFLICCIFFITGIAVASFLPVEWIQNDLWLFGGMVGCGVMIVLFWKKATEGEQIESETTNEGAPVRPGRLHLWFLFGLFLFLGMWRYVIGLPANTADKIWYYNGQTATVVGVVANEPDLRQRNQKLEIDVYSMEVKGAKFPIGNLAPLNVEGKILVTTNLYPRYNYGDELEIICKLQAPEKFSGFAYDRYLARYDIYSVCYYPLLRPLGHGEQARSSIVELGENGLPSIALAKEGLYKKIFNYKNKLRGVMDYGLSEPEASLARAIILGDKKGIPDDLREKFSQAGISHIVAISGMHISILAVLMMSLLLGIGLPRKKAFWLASLFLIFYIMLIGLPASAMRAGLMGFLVLWAMNLGRLNKLTNSLVLAAVVLLLINPKLLRDDIGFQLSFLAVLGIAYCYPILDKWFDKIKISKMKGVRDIFNITIAAQIFTLPIIALNFSQVSIVSLISNLLVLWTLPVLMIASLIAITLSLIFSNFAFVFFLPAWLLLKYIIIVVEWLTKLPYAYVEIDYLWWGWVVVYYGVVGWVAFRARRGVKEKQDI
ncbi:ComEC/Rec2 family competence protein [Candidatus Parcubacteria bacterium]|nr:ComEC/Rec2 family competence protein [Candidatus Parcubacteria bacterium]